jgi:hypothetical protein
MTGQNGYAIRSVCPCGWWHTPHHGSGLFSRCDFPCCPDCGEPAHKRERVAAREVKVEGRPWWRLPKWRLELAPVEAGGSLARKSCRGIEYDLLSALRRNPTIIQSGDDICAIAAEEIERMHLALGEILEMDDLDTAKARALVALPEADAEDTREEA